MDNNGHHVSPASQRRGQTRLPKQIKIKFQFQEIRFPIHFAITIITPGLESNFINRSDPPSRIVPSCLLCSYVDIMMGNELGTNNYFGNKQR